MFKVAHVLTNLALGGPQGWTATCVRMADTSVFEPHLISGTLPPSVPSHERSLEHLGERLHLVPNLGRAIDPVKDGRALFDLLGILRRERFDLVHTHMSKAGVLGRAAARFADPSPLVVHTAHGWSFWHSPSWPARNAVRLVEQVAARWTDLLLVVCDHDRQIALNQFGFPPSLIGDGRAGVALPPDGTQDRAASARRRLALPVEGSVVGTVTRLVPNKRVEDFIRAAAIAGRAASGTTFVVVGSGPEERRLRALASEQGVDRLIWLPTRPDVSEVLPAFDVFVHPSRFEGLPMAILEAMSAGVPVVAEDAGGTREVVRHGETGLLVPIGDVESLARAIVDLLSSPDMARRLQSAGRALVAREHANALRVRALEQQYLDLLSTGEPAPRRDPVVTTVERRPPRRGLSDRSARTGSFATSRPGRRAGGIAARGR